MADSRTRPSNLSRRQFNATSLGALAWLLASCGSDLVGDSSAGSVLDGGDDAAVREIFGTRRGRNPNPAADGVDVDQVTAGFNQFALDLHRAAVTGTENVIVGPYSLATALSMTMAGTAGDLRSGLAQVLGVPDVDPVGIHPAINALDKILEDRTTDKLALKTANSLFVQPGLGVTEEFLDIAVGEYGATVAEADFATRGDEVAAAVNDWVSEQTDGFIEELVKSFSPNTVIALVNAIFLKADWGVTFTDKQKDSFRTRDGESIEVPFFGHDDYLPQFLSDELGVSAVEMPYDGGNLSMVAIMPDDMDEFEASLDLAMLEEILDGLREQGIHLALPKWSFEKKIDALAALKPLGLPTTGDFSPMFEGGDGGFFIGQIDHKARIEVDEKGTTAAAASDVGIAGSHGPTVTINRPFFYIIRDRGSKVILFAGTVNDPRTES